MSSRADILAAVRKARIDPGPLPPDCNFPAPEGSLVEQFTQRLTGSGGQVSRVSLDAVAAFLQERFPSGRIASTAPRYVTGDVDLTTIRDARDLASLGVMVCSTHVGIAECGAVWLSDKSLVHRAAAFLAQHLVVVLKPSGIVWNMHDAYSVIDLAAEGFGVWVAGPSKTADIEQSLVIGAHGARSFTVLLV